jgi:hypothetical protein
MSSFKVGDRVRVVLECAQRGALGTITGEARPLLFNATKAHHSESWRAAGVSEGEAVYRVTLDDGRAFGSIAQWVRLHYDGAEPVEWTEELRSLCRSKVSA